MPFFYERHTARVGDMSYLPGQDLFQGLHHPTSSLQASSNSNNHYDYCASMLYLYDMLLCQEFS